MPMQLDSACSPPALVVPLLRPGRKSFPDRVDTTGPYRIVVTRRATSPAAAQALLVAEAVLPARAAVLAAGGRLSAEDSVAPDLWWSDTFDRVRLPFAVTGAAAQYYTDLTDAYRRGVAGPHGEIRMRTSRVAYRATVEEHASWSPPSTAAHSTPWRDVSVVRLSLAWDGMCGDLCGQSIRKTRTVIVSARGDTVLAVCGDGRSDVSVSVRPAAAVPRSNVQGNAPATFGAVAPRHRGARTSPNVAL